MKTRLLKICILGFTFGLIALSSSAGFAASSGAQVVVRTPRGTYLQMLSHETQGRRKSPTILVAPGMSCNSKDVLFTTLAEMGVRAGFHVVRFEWSYCNPDSKERRPSADLRNEIEDMMTALNEARSWHEVDDSRFIIAGKSLGSIVAAQIFEKDAFLRGAALLTPVCTTTVSDSGQRLPKPKSVAQQYYGALKRDSRRVTMIIGDNDESCLTPYLYDWLRDSKGQFNVNVVGGNHGLRITDQQDREHVQKSARNIQAAIESLLNWAALTVGR